MNKLFFEKSILEDLYVIQGKTFDEIAKIANCSKRNVAIYIHKFGIQVRPPFNPLEAAGINKEKLFELYVTQQKGSNVIAEEFGLNGQTVMNWLKRWEIPVRKVGETNKGRNHTIATKEKISKTVRQKSLWKFTINPNTGKNWNYKG